MTQKKRKGKRAGSIHRSYFKGKSQIIPGYHDNPLLYPRSLYKWRLQNAENLRA